MASVEKQSLDEFNSQGVDSKKMASVEKQSLDEFNSQGVDSNAAVTELYSMTQSSSLRNEILEAIESQIRYIASQIATPSVSENLRDIDGTSDASSQGYLASSEDEESLIYETSASEFTVPQYADKPEDEQRFSDVSGTSAASLSISMKLSAVLDRSTSRLENDRKSEITLPSYTEMCGDEENLFAANELTEDTDTDAEEENVSGSGEHEEDHVRLPGCFGDYETGIPVAVKHYRYIGKQRPNYEEFENTARRTVPARVPPADSTAVDFGTAVERWLRGSKGKTEVDIPDYRFPYESDIRQSCSDSLPRLSTSAIDISSQASSNRKRKLNDFESEAGLESSRSETDISRAQPRRLLKRRKISGY